MNKTQLFEKRHRDKLNKEIKLNNQKLKRQKLKVKKIKEEYKIVTNNCKKQKTTKFQKKKQYELNRRKALIRKQNESNKEINQ